MPSKVTVKIESRVHLLSTLAEAAELEHDLMCMYLYSVFSLKTSTGEGLTSEEMEAVSCWRKTILDVCFEEMTHLALVANLTTAVGGGAHFFHPAFPVQPGYFPCDFVLELAPFNQETLQHFIFLERPEGEPVEDAEEFTPENEYTRGSPHDRLMAHTGDYSTVGQLYEAIERAVVSLSSMLGEKNLFCGCATLQISPEDVQIKGLRLVNNKASALDVLRLIVEQGEGARTTMGSHFEKFNQIAKQYDYLLSKNPTFEPGRPAVRNPVMRRPATQDGRVWVHEPSAARYLDLANALYALMLRFLVQVYSMENRDPVARKTLLEAAFSLMHGVAAIAGLLTKLPANRDFPGTTAGINFALDRYFTPFELASEKLLLVERVDEILDEVQTLRSEVKDQATHERRLGGEFGRSLDSVKDILEKVRGPLGTIPRHQQRSRMRTAL
jgi:hypothetical protein